MKWLIFLLFNLLLSSIACFSQGENNIWTFASEPGANNIFINFNTGAPILTNTPNYTTWYGSAVCYPNGQLRFFIRLTSNTGSSSSNNIFESNGTAIVGSNLGTGNLTDCCMPVIIPKPGNTNQYYIFYSFSNGLRYSLLDMALNNGHGALVSGQKDINIAAYGSIVAQKMTAVKGCDGVWLVVRSRVLNGYYSYHVTTGGLDTNKVVSDAGNFSMSDYAQVAFGFLKAAPDGGQLAICGWAGVELYDFEKCSGRVKNAKVLEATGNSPLSAQNINNHTRFQDVCFSPDGAKLYATQNTLSTLLSNEPVQPGKLFQYDLSFGNIPAIIASKTLLLTNYPSFTPDISLQCIHVAQNPLGAIKAAPNGKLYIDNGSVTCLAAGTIPPGYNPGPGFHVINQPDLQGLACLPEFNAIVVNDFMGNQDGSFYGSGDGGSSYLQQDIIIAPPTPDTISGLAYQLSACFKDSMILLADSNGTCYQWDDGSDGHRKTIFHSGVYYVRYFKNCHYTTDTFHAELIRLPSLFSVGPSCPGMYMGKLLTDKDTGEHSVLTYTWKTADSNTITQRLSADGDSLAGLDTGRYFLEIKSPSGCDTTLSAYVSPLAKPTLVTSPNDTMIHYGDSITLHVSGGVLYTWLPSGIMDTATKANPLARPAMPVLISVIGMNEYGCEDTAYVKVAIDYTMQDFVPNAFSPNGDGLNDVFKISNITFQKVVAFRVYNRFGQKVFTTLNGQQGWDGTQNNKLCDIGTYYYYIELDYPDGKRKIYKGDLLLLR